MEMYWSVERCGWAPCEGGHDAVGTSWSARDDEADAASLSDVPAQREAAPAPVEA